jgi:hypothetical protein
MTTPANPSAPKKPGDDRNLVAVDENYVALTFEDRLRIYWKKNASTVTAFVVIVLLAILAKGGWDYFAAQKELEIEKAYAAAGTPEQLKAFAAGHADHVLAGLAQLRLADGSYAAGRASDAISGYEAAIAAIKSGPLASRARLGLAMAKIQAGRTADGEAALKQLASDTTEAKAARVEAAYQLASLASVAGRPDDVRKYSDQVMQIDPASVWMQRALMLRASLPIAEMAPAGATPAVKFPAPTGK